MSSRKSNKLLLENRLIKDLYEKNLTLLLVFESPTNAFCHNEKELAMYLSLITRVAKFISMDLLLPPRFIRDFVQNPR